MSIRFLFPMLLAALAAWPQQLDHRSAFLRVALAPDQPNIRELAVDSLGKHKLEMNVMLPAAAAMSRYEVSRKGMVIEYRAAGSEGDPAWSFELSDRGIVIRSAFSDKHRPDPLVLNFDPIRCHATLLGLLGDDGNIRLPALLRFPDHGTFRITSTASSAALGYDAARGRENFARVTFSPATSARPRMPQLAEGVSALDILRQSLDRYTGGMRGYGMQFYGDEPGRKHDYLDTNPSLVMAAADYGLVTKDLPWLERNYVSIRNWADKMIEFDRDGDGLMEYAFSGNSWTGATRGAPPSNWWDTINFGHKDAYSNALAYPAFLRMAELSRMAGRSGDANKCVKRAEKLKSVYYETFYNPATGMLAGWKSADGKLHDYYFLFVNAAAVIYGLVDRKQGNRIWDRLLAKIKEAGSDAFRVYENGGAMACYAYFTIRALQLLGRNKEADAILFPMLKSFEDGAFQGRGPNGLTCDWKD